MIPPVATIPGPSVPYNFGISRQQQASVKILGDSSNIEGSGVNIRSMNELLVRLPHTGITRDGLVELRNESQHWGALSEKSTKMDNDVERGSMLSKDPSQPEEGRSSSINQEAKEKKEKKWKDDQKIEAEEKEKTAREKKLSKENTDEENDSLNNSERLLLKDEPEYLKYFKMLKIGMPKEQVVHAMKRDEKDPAILDLDPAKPLAIQRPPPVIPVAEGPVLSDDPAYAKYFKMLKMGMPRDQVLHAMKRDEKDPAILDLDPSRSLTSQKAEDNNRDCDPPLKEDPEYSKYFKMLAMKLPMGAVKNALVRDGKDPSIMDLDHTKSLKSQITAKESTEEDTLPKLKDDPEYAKYFKMLAMKLPMGAVKNALVRDGKDPSIMDLDPNRSVASQLGTKQEEIDTGTPLKDDAEFSKYFKMEKMGLPRDAIKNALIRDGKDPGIIDLDPNKSVASQMKKKKAVSPVAAAKKKKKVRRKKIYWNAIDPGKIKKDSMWNIVRDNVGMDKLKYDQKEFEELFTESADPSDRMAKQPTQKEEKKLVQVIDPKRSMNGGIVLARLKTDHKKIAEYVDKM
jgi:hypothetical protein